MTRLTSYFSSLNQLSVVTFSILIMLFVPKVGQASEQHNQGGPNHDYVHEHGDSVPNFGKNYTARSIANGNWSNPSVWRGGTIPAKGSIVRIGAGTTVTYDVLTAEVDTIGVEGTLRFSPTVDTRLKVANLLVYRSGYFEIGTESTPIESSVSAEVIIANKPLDIVDDGVGTFDPEQWGTALLNFGKVRMYGHKLESTFVRLAQEPSSGDATLALEQAVPDWRTGDMLLIPDTLDKKGSRIEEVEIQAISDKVITLTKPLKYIHPGAINDKGQFVLLPHVINMSRNIRIRSEYNQLPEDLLNPVFEGTRGHTAHLGSADVNIQYVSFKDLGRTKNLTQNFTIFEADLVNTDTNETYTVEVGAGMVRDVNYSLPKTWHPVLHSGKVVVKDFDYVTVLPNMMQNGPLRLKAIGTNLIARYAVHTHHVSGPRRAPGFNGYQFQLVGNAVDNGGFGKWGLVIHGSHFGLIQKNIVYDVQGAGVVLEDGSETENLIEQNFALQTKGFSGSIGQSKQGLSGDGFWFRGTNNSIRGNVAANNSSFGFTYMQQERGHPRTRHEIYGSHNAHTVIPRIPGADLALANERDFINGQTQVIKEFDNNESYAAFTGLNLWTLSQKQGASTAPSVDREKRNVMSNTRLWFMEWEGIFSYGARHLTADGFTFLGKKPTGAISRGIAFRSDLAKVTHIELKNAYIYGVHQGLGVGVDLGGDLDKINEPGSLIIENVDVHAQIGLRITLDAWDRERHLRDRNVWIKNSTFTVLPDFAGEAISMKLASEFKVDSTLLRKDNFYLQDVRVFDRYEDLVPRYNLIQNGRLYFEEQAANYIMPKTFQSAWKKTVKASPVSGLTNQQNWDNYGIAMAGGIALCEQTLNNVTGFICEGAGENPLPPKPRALDITPPTPPTNLAVM